MRTEGIRYRDDGGLEFIEMEVPPPGPGEVQLETAACGICAMDLYAYRHGARAFPFSPPLGHEGLSYVREVGPGVEGYKKGDRVTGGGFARISNVPVARTPVPNVCPVPDNGLADEHWIVEPVSCAVTGIDRCEVRPGDRIAVIGCGFMGLLVIQGLARSCLGRLIALDLNPDRLERARQCGADETLNPGDAGFEDEVARLRNLELETVVEASGTQSGLDLATRIARIGGRINLFGWIHGEGRFQGDAWHMGGFTVINSSPLGRIRETFEPAVRLIDKGVFDLRPLVTHVVSLEEYPDLLERVAQGKEPDYVKGVVKLA